MDNNLIKDLNILTTIPTASLDKLEDKVIWLICDNLTESIIKKEKVAEIDIAIGKLIIKIDEENIKYKFIPYKKLEENIKSVVVNGKNPLEIVIEENLSTKFINTYKDLF